MVAEAREAYPTLQFVRADARDFAAAEPFDAVFSNAALHWISDQAAVTARVTDLLRLGGRYVAELGGSGNVQRIVAAVTAACAERGHEADSPWYFPTVGEHAALLERHGLEVTYARLFDRPTWKARTASGSGSRCSATACWRDSPQTSGERSWPTRKIVSARNCTTPRGWRGRPTTDGSALSQHCPTERSRSPRGTYLSVRPLR